MAALGCESSVSLLEMGEPSAFLGRPFLIELGDGPAPYRVFLFILKYRKYSTVNNSFLKLLFCAKY